MLFEIIFVIGSSPFEKLCNFEIEKCSAIFQIDVHFYYHITESKISAKFLVTANQRILPQQPMESHTCKARFILPVNANRILTSHDFFSAANVFQELSTVLTGL